MQYEFLKDKQFDNSWRVEGMDTKSGEVSVAIFCGHKAEECARQYFFFITEQK